ncbi:LCP family protein [Brachybacterium halotolerans subsp. kimchii]|uniref:LCP family protein n=1 Tax=Brachybacterium halotolerans TaxID=2795215 RepID=UPI001E4D6A80|nr:LCP family protein [Brachybacterium halotolerans]UEJ84236.1 LCP family protein [Brachybacterium halotolerans subsp. kimchii]
MPAPDADRSPRPGPTRGATRTLHRGPAHLSPAGTRVLVRRRRRRTIVALAGLAALSLVALILVPAQTLRSGLTVAPLHAGPAAQDSASDDGSVNILVLGSDSRVGEADEKDSTARSDSILLAHLNADDSSVHAVQIPRDTLMDLPACADTGERSFAGGRGMINSVLNYGPACSVAAVESLTGVHVDHFVEVDFAGFAAIVDALDGLPVCLPEALHDSAADLDLPAGRQTLDGRQALALARTRHAVGDGSDIARLDHQQQVMKAIMQRAESRNLLTRPDRLYPFLQATSSALTVDDQLGSIPGMTSLASRFARVPSDSITVETMPWSPAPSDPNRVVPSAKAAAVFASLSDEGSSEHATGEGTKATSSASDSPSSDTPSTSSPSSSPRASSSPSSSGPSSGDPSTTSTSTSTSASGSIQCE